MRKKTSKLAKILRFSKITQTQLANEMNLSKSSINAFCINGIHTIKTAKKFADFFKVPAAKLLDEEI